MDKGMGKGQIAVEFLMYAGLFMLVVIGAFVLTTFTEKGEVSYRQSQMLHSFGYKFSAAPTVAYKGGVNFTYDAIVPKKLNDKKYNVTYICNGDGITQARDCYAQVVWEGSYYEYIYPYAIAPAFYEVGDSSQPCLEDVSSHYPDVDSAIVFYPENSVGHIIFRNAGFSLDDDVYPTIGLYCEVD